jgi:hypothetical protein
LKSEGSTRLVWQVCPVGQSLSAEHICRSPSPVHALAQLIDEYDVPVWLVVPQQTSPRPHSELTWHSVVVSVRAHVVAQLNV